MATPPNRNTANTNALANQSLIVTAADQQFIDGATLAINNAIALGQFQVSLTTIDPQSIQTLHDYFVSLGYVVSYPDLNDLPGSTPMQPSELFGQFWDMFWAGTLPPALKNPIRTIISWK